jgi:DNA-binding GntR family transcriptional regulator
MQDATVSLVSTTAPAARRAYDLIRAEILEGRLPGGALLSEVEVATRLGVSRTPVHEAFRKLEAEELLELAPRRGAVVVPIRPGEAADVLETRHALEVAATRRLANGTPADRAAFARLAEELLIVQDRLAGAGDFLAFADADAAFHRAIVASSGNAIADRFYASLADRQRRMTIGAVGGQMEKLAVLAGEHRRLAGLVVAAEVAEFDLVLAAHLATTHQIALGPTLTNPARTS